MAKRYNQFFFNSSTKNHGSKFKVIEKKDITDKDRKIFAELLQKQGKVKGNLLLKADRCKEICIAYIGNAPVAIAELR